VASYQHVSDKGRYDKVEKLENPAAITPTLSRWFAAFDVIPGKQWKGETDNTALWLSNVPEIREIITK
jgi:hypothetical protein